MIIHNVEQNSDEWIALRSGMPTASEFSKIVTGTGKQSSQAGDYAMRLAGEMFAGKPLEQWQGNQWTERGHELEADAADEYELIHGLILDRVGFVTDDDKSYGCSPDYLVGDDGVLEIKCLKVERHIEALQTIEGTGVIPAAYRSQVQGEIMVTERDWCDVMFYHPDLPSKVLRVFPDEVIRPKLLPGIKDVINDSHQVLRFLKEMDAPKKEEKPFFEEDI